MFKLSLERWEPFCLVPSIIDNHTHHTDLEWQVLGHVVCKNIPANRIKTLHPRGHFTNDFSTLTQNWWTISFCQHPSCSGVIAMKFCTWHDSWAVVPCAKFCSNMILCNKVWQKNKFPWNLNYSEMILGEMGPSVTIVARIVSYYLIRECNYDAGGGYNIHV